MNRKLIACVAGAALAVAVAAEKSAPSGELFARQNLIAWCIVPFDAKHRGPEERAQMLKRLGITRLAYDWRDKDIPTFDAEIDALQKYGIRLDAFWLPYPTDPARPNHTQKILEVLKRRKVKTQLWFMLAPPKSFADLPQEEKVKLASDAVAAVAKPAKAIGCSVGLYNHGGWFGEPENQVAIINRVRMNNVGIVYNMHHGHEQMPRFPQLLKLMLPHLMAININGMRAEGPMILPLGDGDRELGMLRQIRESGYKGPIGILNHRDKVDAEEGLAQNLAGLKKLLAQMGEEAALKTY